MSSFSSTVTINAAAKQVFAVLCDVERWPEWTATMTSVQRLDGGPLAIGSQARIRQPKLRPAVWQVTELEENRSFAWITHAPGTQMKADHVIEAHGHTSLVLLSFDFSGLLAPLVSRLYGNLVRHYIDTEAQGLKRRSES
jgi:uncharacterized membrane protein